MGDCAREQDEPLCELAEADVPEDGVLAVVSVVLGGASVEVGVGIGVQAGEGKVSEGVTYDEDGDVVMSG